MEASKDRSRKMKMTLISLVGVIIVLLVGILVFFLPKGTVGAVRQALQTEEEYILNLEEFVVNLQSEGRNKAYLKIEVSMMHRDKKEIKHVETSKSKIRDIVLNNLRTKTSDQMLDVEETDKLKESIRLDINKALDKDIIKEIYYTNLIIQ